MKNLLGKLIQIIIDIMFGFAAYYMSYTFTDLDESVLVFISLLVTAIFAEFFEIRGRE